MKMIENDSAYDYVCIEAAKVKELGCGCCCSDCCWIRIST